MGEEAEVAGFPAGAHDAGGGVVVGFEEEVAEFVGGGVAEEFGEVPVGVLSEILDTVGVEAGEDAQAGLDEGHAGGFGVLFVRAGGQLEHEATGAEGAGAFGLVERLAGEFTFDPFHFKAGLLEDFRGFLFHRLAVGGAESGGVIEVDGEAGLGGEGGGEGGESNEAEGGVFHGPRMGPRGACLHTAGHTRSSPYGTWTSRWKRFKVKEIMRSFTRHCEVLCYSLSGSRWQRRAPHEKVRSDLVRLR